MISPKIGDTWYRFQDYYYSTTIDPEREIYGSRQLFEMRTMTVSALTPKGVWLGYFAGSKSKFILLSARRKSYHPTQALALESFIARKKAQVRIYKTRLLDARAALRWGQQQAAKDGP